MRNLFFYLLAITNLISVLHLGFYVVGANVYDIKQFKGRKRSKSRKSTEPLVSVVIPAHNEALVIGRTLDSVVASTYKNLEIVVVDDGSTDGTAQIVAGYIAANQSSAPKRKAGFFWRSTAKSPKASESAPPIRVVTQANAGKGTAMNNALFNHVQGTYFMCLDADSMVHPEAIARAVARFGDPSIIGVAANVRIMQSNTILGMVQRFEHLVGYRAKKFYSLTNSEFIVGGVASTYLTKPIQLAGGYDTDTATEDIGMSLKLIAQNGNLSDRIIYAADVVAMTEGVQTYKALLRQRLRWKLGSLQNLYKYRSLFLKGGKLHSRMLTMYRLPMALASEFLLLLSPIILAYVVYLSIKFHTPNILLGAYITSTLYTLWTLWPDEHLVTSEKIRLSTLSFGMYALFFIMDTVQIYAILRSLKDYKKIFQPGTGKGIWVSPERSGKPASFTS